MKKKVVILGGGPCGLCAAWELSKNSDFEVTVIEKEAKPGGLCITNERNGYRFDLGGHRFISKNQELVDNVCDMMGDQLLTPERRSVILMGGKEFKYPLAAMNIMFNMDIWTNIKAFVDYLMTALTKKNQKENANSFEDWIVNRFGRTLYDIFFGPYTEKLWGMPPDQISSDWASQRISLLNLGDVLLRLLKLKGGTPRTYAQKYYYPKKGIGQMFDIMADVISLNGGTILYNTEVKTINSEGMDARIVSFDVNGNRQSIECDYVISTIPLTDLVNSLSKDGEADLKPDIDKLKFRGVRFMNIMVDRVDISQNTWMYVSEKRHIMTRIQEPKRRSPYSAPEGKTSVMLEIPCDVGDDVWGAGDKDIFSRCVNALDDLGVRIEDEVTDYFSTFVTHGYPIYSLNYNYHRKRLLNYVHKFNNVITCGRQGTFRYIFMDIAMDMGIEAARKLIAQSGMEEDEKDAICSLSSEKRLIEVYSVTA